MPNRQGVHMLKAIHWAMLDPRNDWMVFESLKYHRKKNITNL